MPRRERITHAGFYHTVCRGVERRNVFLESSDYDKFLEILSEVRKEFNVVIHAFCLMTNHYHLLLETKDDNISLVMKYLNSHYAIYFNKKYKRTGHLWQGRFHSDYLYDEQYFWYVAKYIERNPIKANMVKELHHYKYQSYFQWKYQGEFSFLLQASNIFDLTLKEYEFFISSEFEENIFELIYTTPKIVKSDGTTKILYKRLITFFENDVDINRNYNIKRANDYGYTKSEIAKFLKLSPNAIAKIINQYKFD